MYRSKFVEEKDSQPALDNNNEVLKNVTIAVSLKYLSNTWRSLEMPLINCKIEVILKKTKHYILGAAGVDNVSANDNIISTIKETKLNVPVVTNRKGQSKTIKTS